MNDLFFKRPIPQPVELEQIAELPVARYIPQQIFGPQSAEWGCIEIPTFESSPWDCDLPEVVYGLIPDIGEGVLYTSFAVRGDFPVRSETSLICPHCPTELKNQSELR